MSLTKKYDGYQSFQYLEAGRDFKKFELAEELDRVDSTKVQLNAQQEQRVEQFITDNILISVHEHLGVFPRDIMQTPASVSYTHLTLPTIYSV